MNEKPYIDLIAGAPPKPPLPDGIQTQFDGVSIQELRRRVQSFRSLDFRSLDRGNITKQLFEMLQWKNPSSGKTELFLSRHGWAYPIGTRFFRVRRKIQSQASTGIEYPGMRVAQDAWNPPSSHATIGRFNPSQVPALYVCPGDPRVALGEMLVTGSDQFYLSIFTATSDVPCWLIGYHFDYREAEDSLREKLNVLEQFFYKEVTRMVPAGHEYFYKITLAISTLFCSLFPIPNPELKVQSLLYESTVRRGTWSVALEPEFAHKNLMLNAVVCFGENKAIEAVMMPSYNGDDGYFQCLEPDSKLIGDIFPEHRIAFAPFPT